MKSKKKGQGAMEYVMTYGWAIIIVMIVGLALWSLGILNLGKTYPKGFSGFSGVRPLDWCVDVRATSSYSIPDGQSITPFTMTIVNAEGIPVDLIGVEATGQCTTHPTGGLPGEYAFYMPLRVEPNGAYIAQVNNSNPIGGPPSVYRMQCRNLALGEPYKFQLLIRYNKTIEGNITIIHKSIGNIWGTFESVCLLT